MSDGGGPRVRLVKAPALRLAFLGLALGALGACSEASAGVVSIQKRVKDDSYSGRQVRRVIDYDAASGETNRVNVRFLERFALISDFAGLTTGPGCQALDPPSRQTARCDLARDETGDCSAANCPPVVYASLGDRDDRFSIGRQGGKETGDAGAVMAGGSGDDELRGGPGHNIFRGGQGNDLMVGAPSAWFDFYDEGVGANGADRLVLRGDHVLVSYEDRSRAVSVDIDGEADDGSHAERDRLVLREFTRFLHLRGGRGSDRLSGGPGNDAIVGGPGADRLRGEAGGDALYSNGVEDVRRPPFAGGATADRLEGGPGGDLLFGSRGPNTLIGGRDADSVFAGPGGDVIAGRDLSSDNVRCGAGRDHVSLDALDFFERLAQDRCERVRRSRPATAFVAEGADEEYDFGSTEFSESGGRVPVTCPWDAARRCVGTVTIVFRRTILGTGRYSVRRGQTGLSGLRATPRGERVIARRLLLTAAAIVRSRDPSGELRATRRSGLPVASDQLSDNGEGGGGGGED